MACRDCEWFGKPVGEDRWGICYAPIPVSVGVFPDNVSVLAEDGNNCPCFKPVAITEVGNGKE